MNQEFSTSRVSQDLDFTKAVPVIRPSERPTLLPHGDVIEFESWASASSLLTRLKRGQESPLPLGKSI